MIKKGDFFGRDVISIDDFSVEEINHILDLTKDIKKNPRDFEKSMKGRIMAPLFFETSTRTSISFQTAMLRMGGKVLDFDVYSSSTKKGETLRDTVKTIQCYSPDVVVIRHNKDGTARFVADILKVPVINAGDGQNQHPTQTLLDLYTIGEIRGRIEGTKIAIAGDLKYGRTAHSLSLALSKYPNCEIFFVSPDSLSMPSHLLEELSKKRVSFFEYDLDGLKDIINKVEILYMTRVQRERFPEGIEGEAEYKKVSENYHLTSEMLKNAKPSLKIMHPLPKVREIEDEVDDSEHAYYFRQAENGIHLRKALFVLLIG